jgi:hypothetical protein
MIQEVSSFATVSNYNSLEDSIDSVKMKIRINLSEYFTGALVNSEFIVKKYLNKNSYKKEIKLYLKTQISSWIFPKYLYNDTSYFKYDKIKSLILIFLISSFLYGANEHTFNIKDISQVKQKLYEEVTEENINKSISYKDAKKLLDKIDTKFDKDLATYKSNLKNLASNIASLKIKLQIKKDELQNNTIALKNKKTEKKAKLQTLKNIKSDILKAKLNNLTLNITKEFSIQRYYISVISMPLSTTDNKVKTILKNSIITQSRKELSGQFTSSLKVIKNHNIITDYIKTISSAKVSIINTPTNKLYKFNIDGKKIFMYTTRVDLHPFDNKTKTTKSFKNNSKDIDTIFLIEDKQNLKDKISLIQIKFNINLRNLEMSKIKQELKNIDTHNGNSYKSIRKIIKDVKNSKQKIQKRITINKSKLTYEKKSLNFINQDIEDLKLTIKEQNNIYMQDEQKLKTKQTKFKKLKSTQIYTRAMMRDKKSLNTIKDMKLIIDELVSSMDISFKKTSIEIEEILNNKSTSKTIKSLKYDKSYISAQIIPYNVNGADSKMGVIVILKIRFGENIDKEQWQYPWDWMENQNFLTSFNKSMKDFFILSISKEYIDEEWLIKLSGVGSPSETVKINNEKWELISSCQPHNCNSSNITILYNISTSELYGIITVDTSTIFNPNIKLFFIGNPDQSMKNTLKVNK